MTLTEIRNQLVTHFQKQDHFSLKNDSVNIKIDKNQLDIKEDLIKLAFSELEKADMVSYASTKNDEIWALEYPLLSQGQELTISSGASELVANLLNEFKEVLGNGKNLQPTNKLNIVESDIIQLCLLCKQLLEKEDKE